MVRVRNGEGEEWSDTFDQEQATNVLSNRGLVENNGHDNPPENCSTRGFRRESTTQQYQLIEERY